MRWDGRRTAAVILALFMIFGAAGAQAAGQDVYLIESFEDLEAFSRMVSEKTSPFSGRVYLTQDIEAERPFVPIGSPEHMFSGEFDGNGHEISGLRIRGTGEFSGLFGYVGIGGTVKNLTLTGAFVSGERYTGGIAGYTAGTIMDCMVSDSRVHGKSLNEYGAATGGIVGLTCGKIVGCVNLNTKVSGRRNVGGVVGSLCASVMEGCLNTGNVFSWERGDALVGGVVGGVQTGGEVVRCIAAGNVYAPEASWAGGVAGGLLSGSMAGCIFLGRIEGREPGGVAGFAAKRAQIMACRFSEQNGAGVGEGRQDGTEALPGARRIRLDQNLLLPISQANR